MKTKFRKLAELVGAKSAYEWMREAGKINEEFVEQLEFGEIEEIFDTEGKLFSKAQKGIIVDLMAKKANSAREHIKMFAVFLKAGEKQKAAQFLDNAKSCASLQDCSWMIRRYEIRAIQEKELACIVDIAKNIMMERIFS
mgnify:FL=1